MNKNKFHVIHDRTLSLFVAISEFAKYSDNSSRIKTESTESAVDFGRIFPLSVNSSIFVKKDIRNNVGFNDDSFELGKGGMDVTVNGHTQLNGAVITSNADADHNKLNTQTIRATEIKNHSELKTESAAVGTGAMAAMTMAMSALGNQHDTNYSTTKSAIGANIALITEDKNAQNINRNTENTNEKVKKQDLAKAQENQEAAKLVGEIASNLVGIYTFKEREAIEKAKLEVGKLQADAKEKGISQEDLEKSTLYQKAQQNLTALQASYDDNYGIGSTNGRAIQAVTAALQGIAGGSIEQAAVGLASPYLNEQIKQWTTDKDGNVDKTANLAAHAILGALEAQVTGNNALAGAAAATTGEAAAMIITNTLYNGKKAEELTENEKQNVVFLSQVASGLASTFIANDGTASAAMGSEIGKRAVENNLLNKQDDELVYQLSEKLRETGSLTKSEQNLLASRLLRDRVVDNLLLIYQEDPSQLSETQKKILTDEIYHIASSYGISAEALFNTDLKNSIKRDDKDVITYLNQNDNFHNNFMYSSKEGWQIIPALSTGVVGVGKAMQLSPRLIAAAEKYPLLTEMGVTAVVNTGYQLSQDKPYDPYSLLKAELSTVLTRNKTLGQQISINVGINTLATTNPDDYGWNALGAVTGTLGAYGTDKGVSYLIKSSLGKVIVPLSSGYAGEYFGEPKIIESEYNNLKGLKHDK
ncbi:VENN motif pre-toxin domain-containing protein [Actinobacillus minor]|uniref:VENN motif pre-toxin domain-containing protein n=1 Tax=Actinobacillus minor TaxID=51047 RepID=UPI0026ECF58A|nr:VENN motif pre-toxin domain-containing protein [Actinobacillus minor]